jgi:hypothetical protein
MLEAYWRCSVTATSLRISVAGVRVRHDIRLKYIITREMSWSRTAGRSGNQTIAIGVVEVEIVSGDIGCLLHRPFHTRERGSSRDLVQGLRSGLNTRKGGRAGLQCALLEVLSAFWDWIPFVDFRRYIMQ